MAGLQGIAAFAETVRRGSFAAAARELRLTPSAVAKSVARLEADLGLRLLHRTTREVSLTSDGHGLYERCQRVVDEIDALRAEAEGVRGEPSGTLRLSAPVSWGRKVLVPRLAQLVARHPRIALDVAFSDRYADVVRDGFDAVVRIGRLRDSTLVGRRIGEQRLVVCASPAYVAARGTPAVPADLAAHRCMAFRMPSTGRPRPWEFAVARKLQASVPAVAVVLAEGEALVAAAAAGLGIAQVPDYMSAEAFAAGALVELLAPFRPPPVPISVVHASGRQVTPRLRALLDLL